jgi:hypothetical protein
MLPGHESRQLRAGSRRVRHAAARRWIAPALASLALGLAVGCGNECEDGATEQNGPRCCAGGCGNSTQGWSPRICRKGKWACEKGAPEDACASPTNACSPMSYCGAVGIDSEEPDPAPELCCERQSCSGARAVHRVCKSGTTWECPADTLPISTCKDYESACGGILATYRANNYKLPY